MKSRIKSYLMLIGAMLIFGTIGIFRRNIPVSSGLLACVRGLLGTLFLLLFLFVTKRRPAKDLGKKNLLLLILTGGLIGANWILLFEAYNCTSVATATLCYYMEPTIVILVSPLIFKEKITLKKFLCALISVIGMVFVSGIVGGGEVYEKNVLGVLFGLGAAALYSTVVVLNKLIKVDDAYTKTLLQLFSAAVVLVPYLLLTEDFSAIRLGTLSIVLIVVVGIVHTGIAYALYFGSMNNLEAQSIAVLSYIDPVSALILSALILHEKTTVLGITGAVLIIGAALLSEVNFKKKTAH